MWLTDNEPVFFDTDCISHFLSVKRFDIIVKLFGQRIRIPSEVVRELDNLKYNPALGHMPRTLHDFIAQYPHTHVSIPIDSSAYDLYRQLKEGCLDGKRRGSGEAAVMACAFDKRGVVASDNLTDVKEFCKNNGIELISTEHILVGAVVKNLLLQGTAQKVWHHMKCMHAKLPQYGFNVAWDRLASQLLTASSSE